jgi:four helix bundle protein
MDRSKKINSFEDLECWKACFEVMAFTRNIIKRFPESERYDLADNMKRAARSSLRNLSEGFGRFHFRENAQFGRVARGSLFELLNDFIICRHEQYISEDEFKEAKILTQNAIALTNGYIRYLVNSSNESKVSEPLPDDWP